VIHCSCSLTLQQHEKKEEEEEGKTAMEAVMDGQTATDNNQ